MDRRVTILESIERKSKLKPKKPIKLNAFGNRIIENWCAYANDLARLEREKAKKVVTVSPITQKDEEIFQQAYKMLKKERSAQFRPLKLQLKRLRSSRSVQRIKSARKIRSSDEFQCTVDQKKPKKSKSASLKKQKSNLKIEPEKPKKFIIKLPPIKKKPTRTLEANVRLSEKALTPVRKLKPAIVYPPIKTRPWFPCSSVAKPKNKPTINYPPLTLRKTPWQSQKISVKPRTPRVRLEKTFYPIPVSTLGYSWHQFKYIGAKLQILRGHTSQYSKKFNFRSNGKQSAFIAVVALVNSQLCPMKLWAADDLDEIVSYGDINFRKQMKKFHRHAVIKPPEIKFKVCTSRAKIYTEIGVKSMKGIFDQHKTKDFENHLEQLLNEFGMAIFTYCGQSFAIWKELNAFYVFNSEDTDQNGKLIEKCSGACCVIRSSELIGQIVLYLAQHLRITKKCYELFSFKINEKVTLQGKAEIAELKMAEQEKEEVLKPSLSRKDILKARQTGFAEVMFERQPQPEIGESFRSSPLEAHGFLKCDDFLTQSHKSSRQAPFICVTAIAMLRLCKSSLWKASTMREIFRLGHELYSENVEKVLNERETRRLQLMKDLAGEIPKSHIESTDEVETNNTKEKRKRKRLREKQNQSESATVQPDIPITEIQPLLTINSQQLEINSENVIFGKIIKRGKDVISIEDGLKLFFKNFDCGLIQGPEVISVWREQSFYFMFDPNQCEDFQRSKEGDNSCLSWFKDLDALIKLYVDNISKEFRGSIFKIAKVETLQHEKKARGWQNFKAIGSSKWILNGTISESSQTFKEENRRHQSTCIAIAALAKTLELGVQSWTTQTVNEIVEIGDEFYSGSLMTLDNEGKLESRDLLLSEIGTELKLEKTIVDFVYEECVVVGTLEDNDDLPNLAEGLLKFFENDNLAVITTCGQSLAVWKRDEEFFLFDSHERDERGRNLKAIDPVDGCMIKGSACVLRFISIDEIARHIVSIVEVDDTTAYNISHVEATARSSACPCLYNYKKFGSESFAAILFAFNDCHEDSDQFRSSMSLKTTCNLISCLSFTRILNPRQWQSQDINEVLKLGYKLLCNVASHQIAEDDENLWNFFDNYEITAIKMSLKLEREDTGTFTGRVGVLPTVVNSIEIMEDQVKISELELRASKPSITFSEGKQSYASSTFAEERERFNSLQNVLMNLHSKQESFAILHSKLFEIAIFKLDRFYYVFDPKASDEFGFLVRQRLDDFLRRTMAEERKKLLEAMSEAKVKRLSLQEEFEELIFGQKLIFIPPHKTASLPCIAPNVDDGILPVMISQTGSAYITWFSSLELLHKHIMKKIPLRFVNETFTLRNFLITKNQATAEKMESWNNFDAVAVDHWILRAGLSQNDTQFSQVHRNNQDFANVIISLTFAQLCNETDWTSTVLDIILKLGDRLYKKSLTRLVKISLMLPNNLRLRLEQLDLPVYLRPFVISIKDELMTKEAMVKANDAEPLESMKNNLLSFFASSEPCGVLSSKDYHVAIWKAEDGAFMMLDSHDIGPNGIRKSTGFACLQRFLDHKKLVELFHRNVKELDGVNEYQLTRVSVVRNHFREMKEDGDHRRLETEVDNLSAYSDYNLFTSIDDIRSIRAQEVSTIEWHKDNIPMGICYAIATLCISRSLDPEFYTRDIIDKMIIFGNDLISQCEGICYDDFDLCKQQLCPDEINWKFELNSVYANVQMDIFQRGIISMHPCPAPKLMHSIEEFFNFYTVGVLITQSFVVAIWKDIEEYFIFYSSPIDKVGRISKERKVQTDEQAFPGLVAFKSVNELYDSIIGNIDRSSYCKPFELRICTITMTDICDERVETPCNCIRTIKVPVTEELVLPAVEAIEKIETNKEKVDKKCNEAKEELLKLIRAKRGNLSSFISFSKGELVCGQLSKSSKRFNQHTIPHHAGAICLVSVAMSSLQDLSCWCGEIIDCVIKCGNNMYIESSVVNNTKELTMSMLITSLHLGGAEIVMKILPISEINYKDEWNHESLLFTMCQLFSCYTSGYLCRGSECWALFKREKTFYLFDPLGLTVSEKTCQRRATLYKFESIELMIEQLFDCVNDAITEESEKNIEVGVLISCPLSPCPTALETEGKSKSTDHDKKKLKKKCEKQAKTFKPFKTRWMNCRSTKKLNNATMKCN